MLAKTEQSLPLLFDCSLPPLSLSLSLFLKFRLWRRNSPNSSNTGEICIDLFLQSFAQEQRRFEHVVCFCLREQGIVRTHTFFFLTNGGREKNVSLLLIFYSGLSPRPLVRRFLVAAVEVFVFLPLTDVRAVSLEPAPVAIASGWS